MTTAIRNGATFDLKDRRVVAAYETYDQAEAAVDYLTDNGFPVEHTAIVAEDLRYVEQVTGRAGWVDALLRGMLAGAVAGALIGWLFGVFDWYAPVIASAWLAIDGLWFGALVGSIVGLTGWFFVRGTRDFESVGHISAGRYELRVDEPFADQAEQLLARRE